MGEGTDPGAGKECPMEDEKIIELYWQRSPQASMKLLVNTGHTVCGSP